MPDNLKKTKPLAVYFHWPYCKSKCPYCDFFKRIEKNVNQQEIIESYLADLSYYHNLTADRAVRSVFFGGGTPSLIEPQYIEKLLRQISDLWKLEKDVEITLEANPNTHRKSLFADLKKAGINRLSLGVQALNDDDLRFLGRTHNLKAALESIEEVLKIFDNHSMDLIYARPNQSLDGWLSELERAASFSLKHLSLYQLTIEEETVFFKKGIKPLEEEKAAPMYVETVGFLSKNGYPRYEVSNFAPKPFESKHNKAYWLGDEYIGIGESAHGRLNVGGKFMAYVHPKKGEILSNQMRAQELLLMGLRLEEGIDKTRFENQVGINFDSFINQKNLKELVAAGFLIDTAQNLKATDKGFLLLDALTQKLCF
ncbi:MAG: radical SAM family heme chaperone HemW [Alphaproteobacteria bacterium]|nr:radical SAM family heme chaperone HemW [Alphaproteobacteria bacterium]